VSPWVSTRIFDLSRQKSPSQRGVPVSPDTAHLASLPQSPDDYVQALA
jgi:hypothetical protein